MASPPRDGSMEPMVDAYESFHVVPPEQWPSVDTATVCAECHAALTWLRPGKNCHACGKVCCLKKCMENHRTLPRQHNQPPLRVCNTCSATIIRIQQQDLLAAGEYRTILHELQKQKEINQKQKDLLIALQHPTVSLHTASATPPPASNSGLHSHHEAPHKEQLTHQDHHVTQPLTPITATQQLHSQHDAEGAEEAAAAARQELQAALEMVQNSLEAERAAKVSLESELAAALKDAEGADEAAAAARQELQAALEMVQNSLEAERAAKVSLESELAAALKDAEGAEAAAAVRLEAERAAKSAFQVVNGDLVVPDGVFDLLVLPFQTWVNTRLDVLLNYMQALVETTLRTVFALLKKVWSELCDRRVLSRRSVAALQATMKTMKKLKQEAEVQSSALKEEERRLKRWEAEVDLNAMELLKRRESLQKTCAQLRGVASRLRSCMERSGGSVSSSAHDSNVVERLGDTGQTELLQQLQSDLTLAETQL